MAKNIILTLEFKPKNCIQLSLGVHNAILVFKGWTLSHELEMYNNSVVFTQSLVWVALPKKSSFLVFVLHHSIVTITWLLWGLLLKLECYKSGNKLETTLYKLAINIVSVSKYSLYGEFYALSFNVHYLEVFDLVSILTDSIWIYIFKYIFKKTGETYISYSEFS